MKKVLIVAAAASLVSLAACNSKPAEPAATNVETVTDNIAEDANALDAMTANDANVSADAVLENATAAAPAADNAAH